MHTKQNPERFVGMICGPKNMGKSTFARNFIKTQTHLRLLYLDVDLLRPEYTIPGIISLHDVVLESMPSMIGAIFMGEEKPDQVLNVYYMGVEELRKLCNQERFQDYSIIVNTSGWSAGLNQVYNLCYQSH